jgi:ribosomal protein uS19
MTVMAMLIMLLCWWRYRWQSVACTWPWHPFACAQVHALLDLTHGELMKLMTARVRRRFTRGQIPMGLVRKLRKEKNAAAKTGEKPKTVKTHHRNMIIVPEMVGSNVGVYNGLNFTAVEIKVSGCVVCCHVAMRCEPMRRSWCELMTGRCHAVGPSDPIRFDGCGAWDPDQRRSRSQLRKRTDRLYLCVALCSCLCSFRVLVCARW